ncbi:MAG: DUF1963 domain-containing protein [Anaerolineae bacterium]|nr:DUF1963 domain-containing protein [Anaerolineae bacterium]
MIDEQTVRELVEAANLGQFADEIVKLIKPAIAIRARRTPEDDIAIGKSKFGGFPDLPPSIPWPTWQDYPLSFLAQFNLAEVAPYDLENLLPKSGVLYFFSLDGREDVSEWLWNIPATWRVIYYDDDLSLLRRADRPLTLPDSGIYFSCKTEFEVQISLPYGGIHGTRQLGQIGLTEEQDEIYTWEVFFALDEKYRESRELGTPPSSIQQLLGWPLTVQTDLQMSSEIYSKGLSWEDNLDPAQVDSWRLLFEITSDSEVGTPWGDAITLYFMIHYDDLIERNFDRVWYEAQTD